MKPNQDRLNSAPLFTRQASLFFGVVHFKMSAEEPFVPFIQDESLYGPFRKPGPGLEIQETCEISLIRGLPSRPREARMVFDASPAWILQEDGDDHRTLTRYGRGGAESPPLWMAVADADFKKVQVHCGPELSPPGTLLNPVGYPLDQILLLHLMAESRMLLVHGACVDIDGGACVFAGVSGAGKTTLSRLFAQANPSAILTDDRVLLVQTPTGWLAGGTPWPGEGRYARNHWLPLRRISFLEKAAHNRYEPLSTQTAFERLLPVLSIPWFDEIRTAASLTLLEQLVHSTPCHAFSFMPDSSAVTPALHSLPAPGK